MEKELLGGKWLQYGGSFLEYFTVFRRIFYGFFFDEIHFLTTLVMTCPG